MKLAHIHRFFDADVIVDDDVAYAGANFIGVPTGWSTIGRENFTGIGIDLVPADVVLGAIGWD